jgi:DNA-binding MarR family transcriptional regulator
MDREEAARQIIDAVADLFFSAENQARFHGTADELGLQPPALKALMGFEPGEDVPMRQLAEMWSCDASFVTVVSDALEVAGYAARRVAPEDRRTKVVQLTEAGVRARDRALARVYGPLHGFDALTREELVTLAELLGRVAAAQAEHDEMLLEEPELRSTARRAAAQRSRDHRGRAPRDPEDGGWRQHVEAHRREIADLKEELARVRADVKAQARRPVDEAKAAGIEVAEQMKAEVRAMRDDIVGRLRGGRAPR